MKTRYLSSIVSLVLVFQTAAISAETFQSTNQRVNVLELYTSEGCSSCPPADRWLSRFKNDDRLWKEIIPVAFHVDYWNYIGWEDRFSSAAYSNRQRRYASSKGLRTVYTPGFLLNGNEWRSFFGPRKLSLDNGAGAGVLAAEVNDQNIHVSYQHRQANDYIINIAVLGFDLETEINAGENRGKTLTHDFTVLGFSTQRMTMTDTGYETSTVLPSWSVPAPRMAVAVWISLPGNQTPLQATGGWLEGNTDIKKARY